MSDWPRRFAVLGKAVEIQARDAETRVAISAMTDTYPTTSAVPDLRYRLEEGDGWRLWRNEEEVCVCEHALDLPPMLEVDLYRQLLRRSADRLLLHAGAVASGQRGVLLVGESGAGKTTLTTAMTAAGTRYLSDELVAVDADLFMQGMCRPITISSQAALPRPFERATVALRDEEGEPTLITLAHPPPDRVCSTPTPIVATVILDYAPQLEPRIEALRPGDAFERLWTHVLSPSSQALRVASRLVERLPAWYLVTQNVPEAVEAVESVLAQSHHGAERLQP